MDISSTLLHSIDYVLYRLLNFPSVRKKLDEFVAIDPRGRPTVTDHCFCTCRPFDRPSPLFKTKQISSENNVHYWPDGGPGRVDH